FSMIGCLFYLATILVMVVSLVVGCGSPDKGKPKDKTPEPTPPSGVPLGGSGMRDDDTLKNVPSLQRDRQKNQLPPPSSS
ncbi:hypothetical protein PMAYCL1PPCAC_12229, partial [Pristionchus mayeri]